jgi:hypothetical protein
MERGCAGALSFAPPFARTPRELRKIKLRPKSQQQTKKPTSLLLVTQQQKTEQTSFPPLFLTTNDKQETKEMRLWMRPLQLCGIEAPSG